MKKLPFAIVSKLLLISSCLFCIYLIPEINAQKYIQAGSTPVSGNIYHTGGYLGIGTTNPLKSLEIKNFYQPSIRLNCEDENIKWDIESGYDLYFRSGGSSTTTKVVFGTNGNVGIGTSSSPSNYKLEVIGNVKATKFFGDGSGLTGTTQWTNISGGIYYGTAAGGAVIKVGIGETNPAKNLVITNWNPPTIRLSYLDDGYENHKWDIENNPDLVFKYGDPSTTNTAAKVVFSKEGNVGIGTTSPGNYKLNVWGAIRAHEIKVNTTGADFVFDESYKLRSLSEVETFIKQHKRLPDIAPASEMPAEGANVGDLQTKLLQKIEELTLYVIEQEKKNATLEQEVKILKELLLQVKK